MQEGTTGVMCVTVRVHCACALCVCGAWGAEGLPEFQRQHPHPNLLKGTQVFPACPPGASLAWSLLVRGCLASYSHAALLRPAMRQVGRMQETGWPEPRFL